MAILFILLASGLVALSNLFMRKSIDKGGTTHGYLVVQLNMNLLIAILIGPLLNRDLTLNMPIAVLGLIAGLSFSLMMKAIGKSLQFGPSGLTFALLNCSSVFPALAMTGMFGASFGYAPNLSYFLGISLVILGLFWAARGGQEFASKQKWTFFALGMFACHFLLLLFIELRSVWVKFPHTSILGISLSTQEASNSWFMPMMFVSAAAHQTLSYLKEHARLPAKQELPLGLLGGIANGMGTFFLIKSSEYATSATSVIIYPLYAVAVIVFCNLWAQTLYKERIHWLATTCSATGILIALITP